MANNNANLVSAGKPAVGGGISVAPVGTALPTSALATLNVAFAKLGYVSEDGVTNSYSIDNESVKAWGGDTVLMLRTGAEDTFKFTLLGVMDPDALKAVFGSENVSGTLATGIAISVNNKAPDPLSWVFDMILNGGSLKRIVVPSAVVTEIGDIVYVDNEPIGYEVTITATPDASGNTHYDYTQTNSGSSS